MIICFLYWNRLGLTAKNLDSLLRSKEEFDLYIVDNNSKDDTFKYLKSLKDSRIKEIKRFNVNRGLVYAANYVISKRKEKEDFMYIENDVEMKTSYFLKNIKKLLDNFPEVGILGNVRDTYFEEERVKAAKIEKTEIIRNNSILRKTDRLVGCCLFFPGEVMDKLGYFNETGFGDSELSQRVRLLGKWLGYIANNLVHQRQSIPCEECLAHFFCSSVGSLVCFKEHHKGYGHGNIELGRILHENYSKWKFTKENVYCGSVHDKLSQSKGYYSAEDANKVFSFFSKRDTD